MRSKTSNSSDLKIKFGSVFPALLLAGAILCGPGWGVQRCAAQLFPSSAGDEQSYSIGVFQLTVNPAFNFLFAPYPNTPGNYYYPGFSPVGGVLTSPTMYDFVDTYIAVSASHNRAANPTYFTSPDPGGVRVGTVAHPGFPNFIPNYSPRYAFLPPVFATAPNNVDEIMTEIEGFNLATTTGSAGQLNCPTHDPRVPDLGPAININMVVAGPAFIPGLPQNRRSIGMVQQLPPIVAGTDFPAQSFFDIFVEVTLPQTSGNNSANDFPGLLSGIPRPPGQTQDGAVLYNDANNPLVIVNPNVMSLPPTAVYIHGQTLAVPMKFKYANPPYWAADDVIGYLVLAGHGVFPNPSNDCAKVAGGATTLLDQTLGPVGSPMPGMAIPWVQPTNTFPTPNSGYDSLVNTIVDPTSGVTNVNDDTVSFPNGTGFVYIRDLSLGNFNNSIQPPPPSSSATYSEANTEMMFELSQDGVNWGTESATGPMMASISNTTVTGSTSTFDTEMLQLDISGGSLPPAMMIRESPTKQSLGKHTIAPDPHGYRVSSFFDVFLELSVNDGLDWIPAERSIRVQASVPPAAPGSIFGSKAGPNILLQWQNNFTLQSTPDLNVPFTDVGGPVPVTSGIYSNLMSGHAMFYRLRK